METIDPVHRIRAITSYRHDDTSSISVSLTLKTVFKAGPQRHTVTAVVQKEKKKIIVIAEQENSQKLLLFSIMHVLIPGS